MFLKIRFVESRTTVHNSQSISCVSDVPRRNNGVGGMTDTEKDKVFYFRKTCKN